MIEIAIRQFFPADIVDLTALYNRYIRETAITFDLQPYTAEQRQRAWMSHYAHSGRYRLFVAEFSDGSIEENRQIIGYASSSQFHSKAAYETSVETSIYLDSDFVGKGLGSQLYGALFFALSQEDVHRAYAGVTLPNEASMAVHRKFGFKQAALYREVGRKFDRYWDVMWLEKELS